MNEYRVALPPCGAITAFAALNSTSYSSGVLTMEGTVFAVKIEDVVKTYSVRFEDGSDVSVSICVWGMCDCWWK